jgi:hypothetical protein
LAARERFEQRAAHAKTERDQAVAQVAELEARLRRKAAISRETAARHARVDLSVAQLRDERALLAQALGSRELADRRARSGAYREIKSTCRFPASRPGNSAHDHDLCFAAWNDVLGAAFGALEAVRANRQIRPPRGNCSTLQLPATGQTGQRKLKSISSRESRFRRTVNHCISKSVVARSLSEYAR